MSMNAIDINTPEGADDAENCSIAPFRLIPVFKETLWGGTRLKRCYGKHSELASIAESWELSAQKGASSTIAEGAFCGMRFDEFVQLHPEACGSKCTAGQFPLLIKLLDSAQCLSVQVHPDDDYAQKAEGTSGKTEMWVILESEPGASIFLGFKRDISRDEFISLINEGTLTNALEKIPVKRGDVFFIPAGTIHSIGAGITLAEIQQNADTTYRVHDFGRLDANGQPRPLHIEQALAVTTLHKASFAPPGAGLKKNGAGFSLQVLAEGDIFTVSRLTLEGSCTLPMPKNSFYCALCTEGKLILSCPTGSLNLEKGSCAFFPAGSYDINAQGNGEVLFSCV